MTQESDERQATPPDADPGRAPVGLDPGYRRVFELVQEQYGVDFRRYRATTMRRRLDQRRRDLGIDSPAGYVAQVESDPDEMAHVFASVLIGVTRFFRDAEAFRRLEERAIAPLVAGTPAGGRLRAWVVGCSSGEEAYSIAILVRESCRRLGKDIELEILASDLDEPMLEWARRGVYAGPSVEAIPPELLSRYFSPSPAGYEVALELRRSVSFVRHDALGEAPSGGFDLISCRNLLIYFGAEARASALWSFHASLKHGGILFLGSCESVERSGVALGVIDRRWRIFEKSSPDPDSSARPARTAQAVPGAPRPPLESRDLEAARHVLLQRYAPASFLVTEELEVLHSFGDIGRYLEPQSGAAGTNLRRLAPKRLTHAVERGLSLAKGQGTVARIHERVGEEATERPPLGIVVRALPPSPPDGRTLYLVSLEPRHADHGVESPSSRVDERVQAVEDELHDTQERLALATENLEAMRERHVLLLDTAHFGVWEWPDVNGNDSLWSSKFYELLGYLPGEISASVATFRDLLHPDDHDRAGLRMQNHLQSGAPFEIEYRLRRKTGEYSWFRVSGQAAGSASDTPRRMVGSILGIPDPLRT